ncbi:peptidase domain-containing ABC transporter [Geothrix sp. PMB-07]|uniref:peptidase domain-containing ABC transporter n=1 Tax=Geothrix sp. PMB-07 TaxID=3068640 RepID=UPI00274217D6|nr:peptidase domain-containing ABC transporter [Geothrix sp. PMB-07]WLT33476.1 peptidase domain-containing ABC transporter [Geothrix sp. PMB-07]
MAYDRVPYIPQMEMVECGAACLAMILAHWGHHAPLPEVREACKVSRDGANAASLLEAARAYGLEAEAVKVELEHLGDLPLPAILHWEFRHFVVLEKLTSKGVRIVDPAEGRRFISQSDLGLRFTGVALAFAPDDGFALRPRRFPSLRRYLGLIRDMRPSLAQMLAASLMLQVVGMVFPLGNQLLVDFVIMPKYLPWLWGLALGLGGAVVAKALISVLRSFVLQGVQNAMDARLMEGFVEHLVRLPLGFFLQRRPGDLVNRVESNTQIRDLLSSRTVSSLLDAFLLLGYAALMLAYHWRLGAIVLLLASLRVALLVLLRRQNEQLMANELTVIGQEQSILVEALVGIETMKATSSQEQVLSRWTPRMVRRLNVAMERQKIRIAAHQFMTLLQGMATVAVFWVGGREVLDERMTLGVFTAFLSLQALFLGPLESLLGALTDLQFLGSHLARLDDVLEHAQETSGTQDPGQLCGAITLEGVSFRYAEGSPWILKDINLAIRPGEKIALVGRSGAGKSTLARLLMGMLLPTAGRITFDGWDLRQLDLSKLRSQLGVVLQDSFLFDDMVRANLSLRDPNMPMERIRWAAGLAQVHEVIKRLPAGYKTRLGENGRTLSGGERQRLCLARAIASQPAILLLDEATSSLDLETEALVHANLAKLGCTRIVIAHRLETLKDADRILAMQDGAIVQQGTFEALCAQPGVLRDVVLAREENRV